MISQFIVPLLIFAAAVPIARPIHPVLTRIDTTNAVGMTIVASATGLTLETLDGSVAKTFPCDGASIKIVSTKTTWSLKDKTGAGLLITDTSKRYLAVVNRGADLVSVSNILGAARQVSVPSHALSIVNLVGALPGTTLTIRNALVVRTQELSREPQPITMVCPYVDANGKTLNSCFGIFTAHTDFGLGATPVR